MLKNFKGVNCVFLFLMEVFKTMLNNLRKIREKQKLSQLALGRKTGIAGNIISNLENGKIFPYAGWRRKLAAALGVSEAELFPQEVAENEVSTGV
jgi:transcriptional regulator with XRE-family HTH domain